MYTIIADPPKSTRKRHAPLLLLPTSQRRTSLHSRQIQSKSHRGTERTPTLALSPWPSGLRPPPTTHASANHPRYRPHRFPRSYQVKTRIEIKEGNHRRSLHHSQEPFNANLSTPSMCRMPDCPRKESSNRCQHHHHPSQSPSKDPRPRTWSTRFC